MYLSHEFRVLFSFFSFLLWKLFMCLQVQLEQLGWRGCIRQVLKQDDCIILVEYVLLMLISGKESIGLIDSYSVLDL
jgi:hypothetical protein